MRFSENKLASLLCCDGVQRTIHIWEPRTPKAVILAIHGGMAHGGDYMTPALYFKAHGMATVSFDMCGHDGKKRVDIPGFDVLLADVLLFLQWVKENYPQLPIFVMGHSMGALIATHLELGQFAGERAIKGLILSSPYYVNAVKVPRILQQFAQPLARMLPRLKVPMDYLTHDLTHDTAIMVRHLADERDTIRATEVSLRFAAALLAAQISLPRRFDNWRHPVFAVVAGNDKLADAQASQARLQSIPRGLLEYHYYHDNYHENFNERNRDKVFAAILHWMRRQLADEPLTA